jgi:hypothetical protein
MMASKIVIGATYRHRASGYYAKVLEIIQPKKKGNTNTYIVIRCGWTQMPNEEYIWVKHFKPCDLEEIK